MHELAAAYYADHLPFISKVIEMIGCSAYMDIRYNLLVSTLREPFLVAKTK
jgi:hypothetical protein